MQTTQEDKMLREEIIKYVDDLIKANKKSYDKRLSPLLYEFFLRTNEKFEWSREEFLKKYQNFRNNVKEIKITNMEKVGLPASWSGGFSCGKNNKGIYLSKDIIYNIQETKTNSSINTYIIDNLFHECLHATDLLISDNKGIEYGLYEISEDGELNEKDTMLNEYANVLSSSLISSDETMYTDNYGVNFRNNGSYRSLKCPGELICATLDITEPQLAKLKDKGKNLFYEYLQNKFPYVDIETTLEVFKSSLNVIYNASKNNDKENISLGFNNIIDVASNLILNRLENALSQGKDRKEAIERIYYDIWKCGQIVKSVDRIYKLEGNNKVFNNDISLAGIELVRKVKIYNRFLDNENLFTQEEKETIRNGKNAEKLIESKFDDDYIDLEFDIEEIVKKYYPQSKEHLNDNTELIKYVRNTFRKTINKRIYEKAIEVINKIKHRKSKLLPLPKTKELETIQKSANLRNFVKYETPIIHNISTQQQNTLRADEESTRDENEDIR